MRELGVTEYQVYRDMSPAMIQRFLLVLDLEAKKAEQDRKRAEAAARSHGR